MCDACDAVGLARRCEVCGGFDWVADVYLVGRARREFLARLCSECSLAWSELRARSA